MAAMRCTDFDTLATVRKLKAVGVDDAQAEAHAEAIASAVHSGRDDLATKADLAAVKTDLAAVKKADVRDNKTIKARIDALKGEIGAKSMRNGGSSSSAFWWGPVSQWPWGSAL